MKKMEETRFLNLNYLSSRFSPYKFCFLVPLTMRFIIYFVKSVSSATSATTMLSPVCHLYIFVIDDDGRD